MRNVTMSVFPFHFMLSMNFDDSMFFHGKTGSNHSSSLPERYGHAGVVGPSFE